MTTVISTMDINVDAAWAYRAFTNATALRQWLCDVATVEPHPRGRMYLWWNGDFYSSGHYLEVVKDKTVKFRWYSSIDPGPSEVLVSFHSSNGITQVSMAHSVPDGPEWEQIASGFKAHWDDSLENLKSVLETGIDLRIANRPMLGIVPGDFTPEQARRLGVPTTEGMRLDNVVEGMGAAAAGLRKDDVIINVGGNQIGNDFNSLRNAFSGKKGGDVVEVTFYRGPERMTVRMELSRRPMLEVPFDTHELARQGRTKYDALLAEIEGCFAGVSDAQACARPAQGGWSALNVLAHLVQSERYYQAYIIEALDGYIRQADGFGTNNEAYIQATTSAYPTVAAMLGALRSCVTETLDLIENLPESFAQDKGSFYQVGNLILQADFHYNSHLPQIKEALATSQG